MGDEKPRVGVSACLFGDAVRWDATDRKVPWIAELAAHVEIVRVCPEVEASFGVPREPVVLRRAGERDVRMIGRDSGKDVSQAMREAIAARLEICARDRFAGFVLKARSPSCGLGEVPIEGDARPGAGLFAAALVERFPLMVIVDDEALRDEKARAEFLERVARATGC